MYVYVYVYVYVYIYKICIYIYVYTYIYMYIGYSNEKISLKYFGVLPSSITNPLSTSFLHYSL